MRIWRPGRCTTESQLIYRFCQEKAGIGIDANIHEESELPEGLRKIELCDAIPWKISLVCRRDSADMEIITRLEKLCALARHN